MTEPLDDTWAARDFPVLREAARLLEEADTGVGVYFHEIAAAVGTDRNVVGRSLRALRDDGLVELHEVMGPSRGRVIRISGDARRLVGQWPSEETALERLIAALEALGSSPDVSEEERTKAKGFAKWLGAATTTVGTSVAAAIVTGQLPH